MHREKLRRHLVTNQSFLVEKKKSRFFAFGEKENEKGRVCPRASVALRCVVGGGVIQNGITCEAEKDDTCETGRARMRREWGWVGGGGRERSRMSTHTHTHTYSTPKAREVSRHDCI